MKLFLVPCHLSDDLCFGNLLRLCERKNVTEIPPYPFTGQRDEVSMVSNKTFETSEDENTVERDQSQPTIVSIKKGKDGYAVRHQWEGKSLGTQAYSEISSFNRLTEKILAYQQIKGRMLNDRQRILESAATKIYQWLSTNKNCVLRKEAFALLDQVQIEHKRVIHMVMEENGNPTWLGTSEKPADFDTLWQGLVAGNVGALRLTDQDFAAVMCGNKEDVRIEGFREEVFSALARIMTRPKGFMLVKNLMSHPFITGIIPKTPLVKNMTPFNDHHTDDSPGVAYPLPKRFNPEYMKAALAKASQNVTVTGAIENNYIVDGQPVGKEGLIALAPGLKDSSYL